MKKLVLHTAILLLATAGCQWLLTGCEKSPVDDQYLTMELEMETVSMARAEGSFADIGVTMSHKVNWLATSADQWCSIENADGTGSGQFRVVLEENGDYEYRETKVTVTSGALARNLKVIQFGIDDVIILDPADNIEVPGAAFTRDITVHSDLGWDVSVIYPEQEPKEWLTVTGNPVGRGALVSRSVTMSAERNSGGESRSAQVVFKATNPGKDVSITVNVTQQSYAFSITANVTNDLGEDAVFDNNRFHPFESGGKLTIESTDAWEIVTPLPDWIESMLPLSGTSTEENPESVVSFKVKPNLGTTQRTATITIRVVAAPDITQDAYIVQEPTSRFTDSLTLLKVHYIWRNVENSGLGSTVRDNINWTNESDNGMPMNGWNKIAFDENGRVTKITITTTNKGAFSAGSYSLLPELGQLTGLTVINFSKWATLKGAVCPELGYLVNLQELRLDQCSLDEIPDSFGALTKLTILNLNSPSGASDYIQFKGQAFPASFAGLANLEGVNIGESGFTSLPAMFTTAKLTYFLAGVTSTSRIDPGTKINGPIPDFTVCASGLVKLNFRNQNMTGTLPVWLKDFGRNLTSNSGVYIALNGNPNLTGNIPAEWVPLFDRARTIFAASKISETIALFDCGLSGTIPDAIRNHVNYSHVQISPSTAALTKGNNFTNP